MYHPTTRVLTVLELLQAHGRLTGAEIASRLEVNIRTARHYIEMLQDLGIPVEAERGRYGAYRLRPGYKLPPLFFTEEEAFALTLGLVVSRHLDLNAAAPAIEGTLAKIERVLPELIRTRLQALEQTLVLDTGLPHGAPTSSTLLVLSTAVKSRRQVRLRYASGQAAETERVFDPYGVVYRRGYWYTIGYCHLRHGQRLFRLDRIRQLLLLEETFTRPPDFAVLAEVERTLASVPSDWNVEVHLETTLEEAQHWISPGRVQLEAVENGVILRCQTEDLVVMARILCGLAMPFTVRRPVELRTVLRQHALSIAAYAARTEEPSRPQLPGQ
jgi:predicted DNA-binding transcriptional regulator YafY